LTTQYSWHIILAKQSIIDNHIYLQYQGEMQMNKIRQTFEGIVIEDELLAGKAASQIRKKILEGQLAPGQKLTESDFAQALGISRACIREAFQILEYEGLVNKKVNKYTEVVQLTLKDIEEIYQLRAFIEMCCFEAAKAKGLLPIDKLSEEALIVDQRHVKSVEHQDSITSWIEEDFSFHEMIVVSSQNGRAIDAWMRLKNQAMLVLYDAATNYWNPQVLGNHKQLIKGLQECSPAAASEMLKKHILDGYHALETAFKDN
jgi:DNA-binding GntR family transcriptional regulator